MKWNWRIDRPQCTGCGICADVCPHEAIRMAPEQVHPEGLPGQCAGCMDCVRECPTDAIRVSPA